MRRWSVRSAPRRRLNFEHRFDYVLRLWTRDQYGRRDDQVHTPKFLMACDVLRWHAAGAFRKGSLVAGVFVRS